MKAQGTFMRNIWRHMGFPARQTGVGWGKSWSTFPYTPAKDFALACNLVSSAVLCTETPTFLSLLAHSFNLPFLI